MTDRWPRVREYLVGVDVLVVYALLVVPLAVGWGDTDYMTPLALPGYLIYTVGTAIGNRLTPNYALYAYWIPFLVGCYGVAVVVGAATRAVRD